mmetsp:Transcript_24527/g.62392  ORF Transcript_24527/g.62392 Transcript_24527/m.62392 type:complete len:204 (-) Transcript_24527:120-731(-)
MECVAFMMAMHPSLYCFSRSSNSSASRSFCKDTSRATNLSRARRSDRTAPIAPRKARQTSTKLLRVLTSPNVPWTYGRATYIRGSTEVSGQATQNRKGTMDGTPVAKQETSNTPPQSENSQDPYPQTSHGSSPTILLVRNRPKSKPNPIRIVMPDTRVSNLRGSFNFIARIQMACGLLKMGTLETPCKAILMLMTTRRRVRVR